HTHTHTLALVPHCLSRPHSLTQSLSHTHTPYPTFPFSSLSLSLSLSVVEDRSSTGRTSLPLPIRGDKWQTVQSAPHMGMCPCMACLHKAWPVLLSIPLSLSLSLSLSSSLSFPPSLSLSLLMQ